MNAAVAVGDLPLLVAIRSVYRAGMRTTIILAVLLLGCSGAESPTAQPGTNEASEAGDDPCPLITASATSVQGGGVPPSVAGDDVVTNLDGLVSALPESAGRLTRTEISPWPRGAAGHWSPSVLAFYEEGPTRVGVEVLDLVHVCSCEAGMGEVLQSRRIAAGAATRASVANHPAAHGSAAPTELVVWVNDRCSVRLWAAPADVLERLANALDWSAIASACPAR